MTKVVYNNCYGGFDLSEAAMLRYAELKNITLYPEKSTWSTICWLQPPSDDGSDRGCLSADDIDRADPILVQVVEELGSEAASGECARLRIRELEPGTRYRIDEYDGNETVMTIDSYDWRIA